MCQLGMPTSRLYNRNRLHCGLGKAGRTPHQVFKKGSGSTGAGRNVNHEGSEDGSLKALTSARPDGQVIIKLVQFVASSVWKRFPVRLNPAKLPFRLHLAQMQTLRARDFSVLKRAGCIPVARVA